MNEMEKRIRDSLFPKDPELEYRLKNDTERFRKGFATLVLTTDQGAGELEHAEIDLQLKRHAFEFGCNAFMYDEFPEAEQNLAYADAFKDLFNLAVIPFYWRDLEPEDGALRFAKDSCRIYRRPAPDKVLEFCEKNRITPKGHPLMWYAIYPSWVSRNPQEQSARFERRFREIAERYGTRIGNWDVINEVLTWSPAGETPMPPEHLELVFRLAEKYFPASAILNYNEQPVPAWGQNNGAYTPLNLLVENLRLKKLKVDCTGLQFHIFEPDPEVIYRKHNWWFFFDAMHLLSVMDNYSAMRMPVNISEITIPYFTGEGIDGESLQADVAEQLYRIWFSHPANRSIIWWNFVDGTAAYGKMGSSDGENRPRGGFLNYDFSSKEIHRRIRNLIRKEWTTALHFDYHAGALNKFRGYYGTYELRVRCKYGEWTREIDVLPGHPNRIVLEVPGQNR